MRTPTWEKLPGRLWVIPWSGGPRSRPVVRLELQFFVDTRELDLSGHRSGLSHRAV